MKGKEVRVGGIYVVSVRGESRPVRIDQILEPDGRWSGERTKYSCTNLATGRAILVRSAIRFRREVRPDMMEFYMGKYIPTVI